MGRLEGKVAIVTGGNSGIGKKTAEVFCAEGASVVITGRREAENQKTVSEIGAQGGEISYITADVTVQEDCRRIVEETVTKYGRIDVLVNNAGIVDKNFSIKNCSEDWFDYVMKVDCYSVYYMCKYALVYMEREGKGSIINISSIGSQGVSGIAYSGAKAAVNAMTKNIACFYGKTAIRCNAVAPGPTPTPLNAPENTRDFDHEFAALCEQHMDMTLPLPDTTDQANAILFFASDDSRSISGQILYVDHGCTLYGG